MNSIKLRRELFIDRRLRKLGSEAKTNTIWMQLGKKYPVLTQ